MREKRRNWNKNMEEKGNRIAIEEGEEVAVFLLHGLTRGGVGTIQ